MIFTLFGHHIYFVGTITLIILSIFIEPPPIAEAVADVRDVVAIFMRDIFYWFGTAMSIFFENIRKLSIYRLLDLNL